MSRLVQCNNKKDLKQKLKEGDVVMILPHEAYGTKDCIGKIGIIRYFLFDRLPIVEVNHSDLPFNMISRDRWALSKNELLKIGTL